MKKFATICALIGALSIAAPTESFSQIRRINQTENQETKVQREQDVYLVQYTINQGSSVNASEFGKLMGIQKGEFALNGGGKENGSIEFYDYDANNTPDVFLIKGADKKIISIGIDYNSSRYNDIKKQLGNRVTLYEPKAF
jgi:hypothetical protein